MTAPSTSGPQASATGGPAGRSYGSGARILSIGLALTGVVTLGFFVLASHAIDRGLPADQAAVEYGRVSLLWSVTFLVCSVIYRPIEQLQARTIAQARAGDRANPWRTPAILQATSVVLFLVAALLLRETLQERFFGGEAGLYWVLVAAVSTYSLSYFARGWLAGSGRPELYGALVFIESTTRCLFPIVVILGLASGTLAVALGIAAAPLVSLAVVPLALRGGIAAAADAPRSSEAGGTQAPVEEAGVGVGALGVDGAATPVEAAPAAVDSRTAAGAGSTAGGQLTLRQGAVFAGSTVVVMLSEQLLITAGVIAIALDSGGSGVMALAAATGAAGAVFNAFLVSRAPLQLFQAVQSTLLPHLAGLIEGGDRVEAARALRQTLLVVAGFAAAVTVGLLALGPWAINFVFSSTYDYTAIALAFVGVGMGLHLAAGTLNQSALAHGRAPIAAVVWALAAIVFLLWLAARPVDEPVLRAAAGYALASGVLLAGMVAIELRTLRGR